MLKFLFIVILLAVMTYAVVRLIQNRGITPPASTRRPTPKAPPRMVAPDDDVDFLRDLDRKRRQTGDTDPGS